MSTPPVTLKYIETGWGGEGVYFGTIEETIVEGCVSPVIRINSDHAMFDTIVSTALSAYHTKSKVVFRISGCIGGQMKGIAIALVE